MQPLSTTLAADEYGGGLACTGKPVSALCETGLSSPTVATFLRLPLIFTQPDHG